MNRSATSHRAAVMMCVAAAARLARAQSYATAFALLEQAHAHAVEARKEEARAAAKSAA